MKTKQIYYEDAYLKELQAEVLSVAPAGNLNNVILDQTIFYPEGVGQPCDRGMIDFAKVEDIEKSDKLVRLGVKRGSG